MNQLFLEPHFAAQSKRRSQYTSHQKFVNDKWMEAYPRLLREHVRFGKFPATQCDSDDVSQVGWRYRCDLSLLDFGQSASPNR
jgi:hypothetical protein